MSNHGPKKSLLISYILFVCFGMLGIHRIYLEKYFTGIFYMFTGGFFGLGLVFDLFTLPFQVADFNACTCH